MYLENIVKEYKDFTKVIQYKHPFNAFPPICKFHNRMNCGSCFKRTRDPNKEISDESLRRTKSRFKDYVLNNDFDLFCTFTFDKEKLDRYDDEIVKQSMQRWLHNVKRSFSPDLAYLIVAERHKDGAIHYHALFSGFKGKLEYWYTDHKKDNKRVYKIPSWDFGIATAKLADNNKLRISRYMTKSYMTKDMILIGNKKRYWASRNLKLPTTSHNVDVFDTVFLTPSTNIRYFETDNLNLYTIQRPSSYEKLLPKNYSPL